MLPYFLRRMWRRGGYRKGFLQRLGSFDKEILGRVAVMPQRRIWVHAVSVGEIRIALDLIAELRALNQRSGFILTTTTSTGHALAQAQMDARDVLLYYPVDFPWVVRRTLRQLQPKALVLVDGEFWPNLLRELRLNHVPVVLVNGRVSARSFRGYQRLRRWVTPVLSGLDFCGMQSPVDADRIIALGAAPGKTTVLGSAKYDVALAATRSNKIEQVGRLLKTVGLDESCRILLGGSTWPGEEKILLDIFEKLQQTDPLARLVLAPRHMERAPEIEKDIQQASMRIVRWSSVSRNVAECDQGKSGVGKYDSRDVLLIDTTGDLPAFYPHARIIFIGKSLCQHGGQNLVEPAAFGKAVVVGPNMENFAGITAGFLAENAIIQVPDSSSLVENIMRLWIDDRAIAQYGQIAQAVVKKQSGVLAESARRITGLLNDSHN